MIAHYNNPLLLRIDKVADLGSIFRINSQRAEREQGETALQEIRYAAAALLMVCANSDFEEHPEELRAIKRALEQSFGLIEADVQELLAAVEEQDGVRRLQEFTRLVNEHFNDADKQLLIENLWAVAFADGRLDRYEEQYISRVAFMIDLDADKVESCRAAAARREG